MTNIDTARKTSSVAPVLAGSASPIAYVDWGAIFAGAVVTAAISTLMTTFGAAIGLSAASPFSGKLSISLMPWQSKKAIPET